MSITIDTDTEAKLIHMAELESVIREQGDYAPEEAYAECRKLRQELVPMFLPLMTKLVDAGLLTIFLDGRAWDVVQAFDNGNLNLVCGCVSMWNVSQAKAGAV